MKKRIYIVLILLLITSLFSTYFFNALEPSVKLFKFKRNIVDAKYKDIIQNTGFGKVISVNDSSFVFIDNRFKRTVAIHKLSKVAKFSDSTGINLPYYFLTGGNELNSGIYTFCGNYQEIKLNGPSIVKTYKVPFTFDRGVVINDSIAVFRVSNPQHEFLVGRYGLNNNKVVWSTLNNILKPQGGLATDGILLYDNEQYLYFINSYNSLIIKFDKNFKTHGIYHTLDNTKELPKIVYLEKTKSYHFSSVHSVINESATVFGNTLYIVSSARGKRMNQKFSTYIDAYNMANGKYEFSYGIPRNAGSVLNITTDKKGKLYLLTTNALKCIS